MTWDKRVSEAGKEYANKLFANSSGTMKGMAEEIFLAGANWARELFEYIGKLSPLDREYLKDFVKENEELDEQVVALRKQCEAMAKALEYELAMRGHQTIMACQGTCQAHKALTSYQKFKEGGE